MFCTITPKWLATWQDCRNICLVKDTIQFDNITFPFQAIQIYSISSAGSVVLGIFRENCESSTSFVCRQCHKISISSRRRRIHWLQLFAVTKSWLQHWNGLFLHRPVKGTAERGRSIWKNVLLWLFHSVFGCPLADIMCQIFYIICSKNKSN